MARFMIRDLPGHTYQAKKRELLNHLDRLLAIESKKTTTFGLPEADSPTSELQLCRDRDRRRNAEMEIVDLLAHRPLTDEQATVFHAIQDDFNRNIGRILYVQVSSQAGW